MEKDDYIDCKFICGIADEGIIKCDRPKWRLALTRHISFLIPMKYVVYTVNNRKLVVLINAKILTLTYVIYNSIFRGNYGIYNSTYAFFLYSRSIWYVSWGICLRLKCYLKGTLMFTIHNFYTLKMLIGFYKGVNANF